ncbi:hypothetical protein MMC09_004487 [Bachmanniomyces sp. S44760]|nr:hypothetical protein [Bachmanniomyces sp. S44760]
MSTISPTPIAHNSLDFASRPRSRQFVPNRPPRPNLKRGSPLSIVANISADVASHTRQNLAGDSSDDEGSVPALSAEAEAILGVERSAADRPFVLQDKPVSNGSPNGSWIQDPSALRSQVRERLHSPSVLRSGSPRVVRLSASSANLRRTTSTKALRRDQTPEDPLDDLNSKSPPELPKNATSDMSPLSGSYNIRSIKNTNDFHTPGGLGSVGTEKSNPIEDVENQMANLTVGRSRTDDAALHGSLRIKRVGKVTGRFLSGPARRGIKRRQSEEDQNQVEEKEALPIEKDDVHAHVEKRSERQSDDAHRDPSLSGAHRVDRESRQASQQIQYDNEVNMGETPVMQNPSDVPSKGSTQIELHRPRSTPNTGSSSGFRVEPIFKVPPLPSLPSRYDQENEPPPTFKRNKSNGLDLLANPRKVSVMLDEKILGNTPATASPPRKVLGPRSQNTPLRPAPPPPKMTVLETVTATVGSASATQAKKKRNYSSVNGKLFTRLDCIGRGGSAKVYRVMAENCKIFALKRVSLEDADELAIRGYKGEIDLLRQLENVDRVVRLFDWEVNDERQTLSVLMEIGESDLSKVLTLRLNADDAKFDINFTRYYWKEMLECVQAVHRHEIVHSDLKPANFLLVQGRLKLIDFGIANAIQDDTVNVHREQQIGTPNYMSPEALIDSNATSGLPSSVGKMMKLGKPSDVWSLGCILYQMVYGKPPFAHIANQMQRVMAIPNSNHVIQYPCTGVGGLSVPACLVKTLRRCLNRDLKLRPTIEQLLDHTDTFLYPDSPLSGTVPISQDLIARIQHSMLKHIKEKGVPTDAELSSWPAQYFASVKALVDEGRV